MLLDPPFSSIVLRPAASPPPSTQERAHTPAILDFLYTLEAEQAVDPALDTVPSASLQSARSTTPLLAEGPEQGPAVEDMEGDEDSAGQDGKQKKRAPPGEGRRSMSKCQSLYHVIHLNSGQQNVSRKKIKRSSWTMTRSVVGRI